MTDKTTADMLIEELAASNERIAELEAQAEQRAAALVSGDPEEALRELQGAAVMDAITDARRRNQ
ncbi:MAG: hypothetical protein WKF33_07705 [Thermoleophilaceae bacterium]